jgi:hypothetical protein
MSKSASAWTDAWLRRLPWRAVRIMKRQLESTPEPTSRYGRSRKRRLIATSVSPNVEGAHHETVEGARERISFALSDLENSILMWRDAEANSASTGADIEDARRIRSALLCYCILQND